MSFDQYAPYGPVTETTVRIATWNVWGRFGRWAERQAGIEDALAKAARPEIVIHMAAQAIVRHSYAAPIETFAANVLGADQDQAGALN